MPNNNEITDIPVEIKETNETYLSPKYKMKIQVADVVSFELSDTLRVAGQIDFDEQALTRIGASVTGRVTQIHAQLGNVVNKGDTLALINSSELSGSQLAYLKARSEKELHRRNVERAKTLFDADVISAAELQRRENEYEIASAETRAAQDQLRVLGVSATTLSTALNFGPDHAMSWLTPPVVPGILMGLILGSALAFMHRKVVAALGLVLLAVSAGLPVAALRAWRVSAVPRLSPAGGALGFTDTSGRAVLTAVSVSS